MQLESVGCYFAIQQHAESFTCLVLDTTPDRRVNERGDLEHRSAAKVPSSSCREQDSLAVRARLGIPKLDTRVVADVRAARG